MNINTVLIVLIVAVSLTIINVVNSIADIFRAKYKNLNEKVDREENKDE